jgi:nucleoside-diphosphate-sugar epimerase
VNDEQRASYRRLRAERAGGALGVEILVTGASGYLGRHLVPALQAHGHTVRALVLPAENAAWLTQRGVAIYPGDVRQPDTLAAPTKGADAVFHLAAMLGTWRPTDDYDAVNVAGTEHVCRAALAVGVRRLVHVSSAMVYGPWREQAVREDFPFMPLQEPYALTKAQGDKVVQWMIAQAGLPAVIIRPGTIFGPGDHLNFKRLAERLRAGKAIIIGSGRNAVPFVYVTDVVQGLLLALEHDRAVGQAYNITNDQPMTQEEFLRAIAQEVGAPPPHLHVPYRALYAAAYVAEGIATLSGYTRPPLVTRHSVQLFGTDNRHAIDKARRELGYAPQVPVREGIRLAAAWYRQNTALPVVPHPEMAV